MAGTSLSTKLKNVIAALRGGSEVLSPEVTAVPRNSPLISVLEGDVFLVPDEVLKKEARSQSYDIYRQMLKKDPKMGASFRKRARRLSSLNWDIQPFINSYIGETEPTAEAIEHANFISRCLEINESELIYYVLDVLIPDAIAMGFSVAEKMISYDDVLGKFIFSALRARKQEYFKFDRDWRLRFHPGVYPSGGTVEIDESRMIVIRHEGKADNPYGDALCQELYWLYFAKKNIWKFWCIYLERFGMPFIDVTYPNASDADDTLKTRIDEFMEDYQGGIGARHPEGVKIALLEATRTGEAGYNTFNSAIDTQIKDTICGESLTSESGNGTGSYALSKVHQNTSDELLTSDARLAGRVINAQVIKHLVILNYGVQQGYPRLTIDLEPEEDLLASADMILKVQQAGMKIPRAWAHEKFQIPQPAPEEDVLEKAPSFNPFDTQGQGAQATPATNNKPANESDNAATSQANKDETNNAQESEAAKEQFNEIQGTLDKLIRRVDDIANKPATIKEPESKYFSIQVSNWSVGNRSELKRRDRHGKVSKSGMKFLCDPKTLAPVLVEFDSRLWNMEAAKKILAFANLDYVGKEPPPNSPHIGLTAPFHLNDPFEKYLQGIFKSMEQDLAGLLETNAPLRAAVQNIVTKRFTAYMQDPLSKFNRDAVRYGAEAIASQLSQTITEARFNGYIDQYLEIHPFESQAVSEALASMESDIVDRMTARFRDSLKNLASGKIDQATAASQIQNEFGDMANWKANQIARSEVNNAANWAALQVIKDTAQDFDAYFLVDPLSCPVCQEWAAQNPYTVPQAEALGLPHPNCNDFWTYVPKGASEP